MKGVLVVLMASVVFSVAAARDEVFEPDEIFRSVQDWIEENIEDDALDELGVDKDRVQRFFSELRGRFQGSYICDLSALKETATQLLPVLRQFEEARPYALWLETHLDYFDVADELRREAGSGSKESGSPLWPAPSPERQRSVWVKEIKDRSRPPLAENYVPRLKQIFAAEKLPPQLVWMAEVESSFNPVARSPAGAAGLFQLMPATARALKLSLQPEDERLETEKSARAAARYLRYLHGRFGEWRLALAAYNAGESRVDGLLKKTGTRNFDAIADRLPAETQMYVPKVEATLRRREGRALAELRMPKE